MSRILAGGIWFKRMSQKSFVVLRVFFVDLCVTNTYKLHEVPQRRHEVPRSQSEKLSPFETSSFIALAPRSGDFTQ
jgi:hypothetical protein